MSKKQPLDIILWAHSDQAGGTEIPCVLASAFLRRTGFKIRCGIVTPFPDAAVEFFRLEGGFKHCIEVIEQPQEDLLLLRLEKSKDGRVEPTGTRDTVNKLITGKANLAPTSEMVSLAFHRIIEKCKKLVEGKIDNKTLFVSCGEAFAVAVAKELNCRSVIVTDHLTTQSVRAVCKELTGELPLYLNNFLGKVEHEEKQANAVYLLPPEFGVREYRDYFEGPKVLETSGLLYDPIPEHELAAAPHYTELRDINKKHPLVIVFGGGGKVWDDFIVKLHNAASNALIKSRGKSISLLIKDVFKNEKGELKISKRTWRLYIPGEPSRKLADPGALMYWYAACTLLVGRGGLAAQQIMASVLARPQDPPGMLFVNEERHPQIKAEWEQLKKMGLVHAISYQDFCSSLDSPNGALNLISNYLKEASDRLEFRRRATIRYCVGAVDRLADSILGWHWHESRRGGARTGSVRRFDDGREFLEILGDSIHFDDLQKKPRPLQLEVILSEDPGDAHLNGLKAIIIAFKQSIRTVVFSGSVDENHHPARPKNDPLNFKGISDLIKTVREGTNVNIGIVSPLWCDDQNVYTALVNDASPGDYVNVLLDAGTQSTYDKRYMVDEKRCWTQVGNNLDRLVSAKRDIAVQLLYGIAADNHNKDDIEGAVKLANEKKVALIFSYDGSLPSKVKTLRADPLIEVIERRSWVKSDFLNCVARLFYPTLVVTGDEVKFFACPETARKQINDARIVLKEKLDRYKQWSESASWQQKPSTLLDACCRQCSQRHGAINVLADGMFTRFRVNG